MVEGHAEVLEPFQFLRKGETAVVCGAGEVREVEAESGDSIVCKGRKFFCGVPEEGTPGVDRGEVLEGEPRIVVAVEEPGESFNGLGAPSGFVPPRVEDDRLRAEDVGGFEGLAHGLLDVRRDLAPRPVVVGGGGAGVDAVAVVGRMDDRRDACRGDPVEVFLEERTGQGDSLHLDMLDCTLFVEFREKGERFRVVEPYCAAEVVVRQWHISL